MGILDINTEPQLSNAEIIANTLKVATVQTFQMMVNSFNSGAKTFWDNPQASPSEIAQELGTDAKEVFQLHYMLGQLIGSVKPEAISEGWSLVGQFTMNDDGTVTISTPATTTPEPTTTTLSPIE